MRIGPGDILYERWKIKRLVGQGGMGYVLEGWDLLLHRRVAIKTLHDVLCALPQVHDRFLTEARALARIDAAEVVSIYDAFDWEGLSIVVMEYVEGEPLSALLERMPQPPLPFVRALTCGVLRGLRAAHGCGIVHRDIKPDNIMVVRDDDPLPQFRILDFGVAQVQDEVRHTRTGSVVGTVRYMSPEQVNDSSAIDARSDIYSLGVVMWEMLAGTPPWSHTTKDFELRSHVVHHPLPPLPASVPEDLRALVARMTDKAPDGRPKSASEALRYLEHRHVAPPTRLHPRLCWAHERPCSSAPSWSPWLGQCGLGTAVSRPPVMASSGLSSRSCTRHARRERGS